MRFALTLLMAATLGACANNTTLKKGATVMPFVLDLEDAAEQQRPVNSPVRAILWEPEDKLFGRVTLDYVSGMSKRDILFNEPNQKLYKPMLINSLQASGLKAQTPTAAQYGLQVEFSRLKSPKLGIDFKGKTAATYRLVNRRTGQIVYEQVIDSSFKGLYTELHEDDLTKPLFGDMSKAVAPVTFVTGLSVIARPAVSLISTVNPFNYVNLNVWYRDLPKAPAQARKGVLSKRGLAARNGTERARQVNYQILQQSITLFLKDLAQSQNVPLTHIVPCHKYDPSAELMTLIALGEVRVRTDDCMQYQAQGHDRPGSKFATWQ